MNAKSKVFGLLAAAALSLSMFGGAIAQSTDSEPVSAVVSGNTVCAIDIYAVGGGFGTWTNGVPDGSTTQYFYGDLYNSQGGCNIGMTFAGLIGPGGLIPATSFSAYSYVEGSVNPASWGTPAFTGPFYDFEYALNSVPAGLSSGVYSGSIVATVSDAV